MAQTFRETLVCSKGADIHVVPPLVARLTRQPDNTQRFIGGEDSLALTAQQVGVLAANTETNYYRKNVATAGSIVHCDLEGNAHFPRSVSWRLFENATVIELEPVDLNYKGSYRFRTIKVVSPSPVFENCISVSYSHALYKIVIDFVSQDWSYYTVTIPLSEFVFNSATSMSDAGSSLTEKNAPNWHRISTVFPFDLKNPHLIHAISPNLLVFSLKNGTLLKVYREAPLNDFYWDIITDPTSSTISRLWRGQSDKCPTDPSISIRTAISISSYGDLLFTVAINCNLRIWRLSTSELLYENKLTSENGSFFGPAPTNILSIVAPRHEDDQFYFLTYTPESVQVWKVLMVAIGEELALTVSSLGDKYSIAPLIPDDTSTWFVNSLHVTKQQDLFSITALLKSNTSSAIHKVQLPVSESWQVAISDDSIDRKYLQASALQASTHTDGYIRWLFGPKGYSTATVEAALEIYGKHYAVNKTKADDEATLREKVCRTVGSTVSITYNSKSEPNYQKYQDSLAQEWERFDRLCSEMERLGNEVLAMTWDPVAATFWVTRSSFTTILRSALPVELIYHNRAAEPSNKLVEALTSQLKSISGLHSSQLLKLVDVLQSYRTTLSYSHYGTFITTFNEDFHRRPHFSTIERISHIRSTLIDAAASRETLLTLFQSINEATGDSFYQYLELIYHSLTSPPPPHKSVPNVGVSVSGAVLLSSALYEISFTARTIVGDILIGLVATLPLGESNIDKHTQLYSKFLSLLNSLDAIDSLLYVPPSQQPETKQITLGESSQLPLSFFQQLLLRKQSELLLTSSSFPSILMLLWSRLNVISEPTAVAQIIAELLASNNELVANEFATRHLPRDSFSKFISAHAYLKSDEADKAVDQFKIAAIELGTRSLSREEIAVIKTLPPTAWNYEDSFGNGLSRYFGDAAKTLGLWGTHSVRALQLAKLARANLYDPISDMDGISSASIISLNEEIQNTLFKFAAEAASLDDAYSALVEIDMLNKFNDETDQPFATENLISPYIDQICSLAMRLGKVDRLAQYPFIGSKDLVTEYFKTKAKESLDIAVSGGPIHKDAFIFYHTLYSWNVEHQDLRGAAAALLMKIQHLKAQGIVDKATILDTYVMLINILSGLRESDQWLLGDVFTSTGLVRVALRMSDIRAEYSSLLEDNGTTLIESGQQPQQQRQVIV